MNVQEAQNRPLDKNLLRYVWRYTRKEQIWLLIVILASMPTYFLVLDLPVRIINEPIQGMGFETAGATQIFLQFNLSLPAFLGGQSFQLFEGFALERWPYLIALSTSFLFLVCINGLFKFYINTYKGRLGERMLRRMRYQLVDRVLRFPIAHFKRVKGAEIASMIKDEVEPFGEFIGDAFVQPVYLGGQALVAFIFILNQSFWLGMIAVGVIVFQIILIPYLRRPVLELGRQRQVTARLLSGRIGEIVDGITSVHVNDTSNYERAELSNRLGHIFFIRYELYQRKFFVKFLNNFLAQFTPYLFYVVGGGFALNGALNVGQLIGVINAYKDLPSPINGLILWDQKRVDINIKYAQIVEQFNVKGMSDALLQEPSCDIAPRMQGTIDVSNLSVRDESGSILVEDADFSLPLNGITAAIGPLGSGAGAMAHVLAGLTTPTSGRVVTQGKPIAELPQSLRGRRISYVGGDSYLPQATLFDTLLYVNKHAPMGPSATAPKKHPRAKAEAIASGNTVLDYHADWIDYNAMGISGPDQVYPRIQEILGLVEMNDTVFNLGMRQMIDPADHGQLCQDLVKARKRLHKNLEGSFLSNWVEVWDHNQYNEHATIADNLVFGTAASNEGFTAAHLEQNSHLRSILKQTGLEIVLFEMGIDLAETALDLFADLSPDNPFFDQLNFMSPEQLADYPPILSRAKELGFEGVSDHDRDMLLQLPFGYIEKRNRLKLLDDDLQERILKARHMFIDSLPQEMHKQISFYDIDTYNPQNSIQENIVFGRIIHGLSNASEQVEEALRGFLQEEGLADDIYRVGLDFDIGTGGKRLSESQRQRIILARSLLKDSDLLIVNRGLNALDAQPQARIIDKVLKQAKGKEDHKPFGVLWVLTTPSLAAQFEHVMVFERQRLVALGSPEKLKQDNALYASLVE